MGINKDFFIPRTTVTFNGQAVCDVRGITPDDIAQIVSENAADMDKLVQMFVKEKTFERLDMEDNAAVAEAMSENSSKMLGQVILQVPNLVAKLIAVSADEPGLTDTVKTWPVPVQFDALYAVAEATFIDKNTFKAFAGKVMALVGNFSGKDQRLMQ